MKRMLFPAVLVPLMFTACAIQNPELVRAAKEGDAPLVRNLLSNNSAVDSQDDNDTTALNWAAINGHTPVVKLLLEEGAEVSTKDSIAGRTALWGASHAGHTEIVELLLESGADVDTKNTAGESALWTASWKGHVEVVQLLLEKGADANVMRPEDNVTALSMASQEGHLEIVKLLLGGGADVNTRRTKDGVTALFMASQGGYSKIVKLLLEKGADADARTSDDGQAALLLAAWHGREDIVKLLLEHGADVNTRNTRGETALSNASFRGHTGTVKLLLESGADVELAQAGSGVTPLWSASQEGHVPAVKLLLENGAAVDAKRTGDGVTALWQAAWNGHVGVVELLLKAGANVDAKRSSDGVTGLWQAACHGHAEVVRLFLDNGADINVRRIPTGTTPLWMASYNGQVDVVRLLLAAEANMNVKAKATAQSQTYTPLGIAKDKGHAQVVALLEEARGKERTARAQVAERERMEREQKRAKWIEGVRACLPDKLDPNAIYRVVEDRGRFRLQKTLKCQPGEVAFLAEVFVPCGAAFVSAPGELSGTVLSLRQLQLVPREGLVEAVEPPVTADTQADVEPKAKDRDYATAGGASVVVTENGLEFRSGTQNGEPIQWVFEGANPNLHVSTAGAQGEAATEDSPAVPDLIAALSDDHARETSIAALAKIGSAAVPGLIEVLRNPAPSASEADVRTRGAIIETLGRIGSTAVPDLISTFSHGASDVRSDAVLAFAWMGPQAGAAVPLLIDVLKHEDENVRVSAVTALGEIGPEAKAAVPHLVELLADPNPTVRTSANLALARIRQDVEALVHLLRKRGDDNTRAHVSLLSIGADAVPSLCNAMEAIGASVTTTEEIAQVMGVLTTLSQISRSEPTTMRHSVPCLLRAARRMTSTTMRTSIVEGIATLFGPPAVPYILAFLQSEWEKPPDIDSNLTVTQGLISYIFINMVEADAANVDPLLEAVRPTLRSSRGSFKEAVILIVGNLSPSTNRVIPFLQHELDSETEPEIRKRLRQAIDSAKQRMKP